MAKIAMLIPSIGVGGAERSVVELARIFHQRGFTCSLIVDTPEKQIYNIHNGVNIKPSDLSDAWKLLELIQTEKYDFVISHYHWDIKHVRAFSLAASIKDFHTKFIMTEHNSYFWPIYMYAHQPMAIYKALFNERNRLYSAFDAITVLNDANLRVFSKFFPKVFITKNPLSFAKPSKISRSENSILLNVSGFNKPVKRLDLLLEVSKELKRRQCKIVVRMIGQQDRRNSLEKKLQEAGLSSNEFQAPGVKKDLHNEYSNANLFALTSEVEGQPMVLLEAALYKLPSVVFDIFGMSELIVNGRTGLCVPFGDISAFADGVEHLLNDRRRARQMGEEAHEYVLENFNDEKIFRQWNTIFENLSKRS